MIDSNSVLLIVKTCHEMRDNEPTICVLEVGLHPLCYLYIEEPPGTFCSNSVLSVDCFLTNSV